MGDLIHANMRQRPSEAPGARKHTHHHVCALDEPSRVWRYECVKCKSAWTMPITDDDVPLVTALRGGRPLLGIVATKTP